MSEGATDEWQAQGKALLKQKRYVEALALYEQALEAEPRNPDAFLWDVTLRGADAKTIDRKRIEYAYPPEPGSVIMHNDSEIWSVIKPEISASDAEADGRAMKLMWLPVYGFPFVT